MGDFLLDFSSRDVRCDASKTAEALRFCEDTKVRIFDREPFSLVLASVDTPEIWGPYESQNGVLITLTGRVAFDEPQWETARSVPGEGGLACKAIFQSYQRGGIAALRELNGHFTVFIHDAPNKVAHLVMDRFGMCLVYGSTRNTDRTVYASHADVLAQVAGQGRDWDSTSFAEFLMTGRLSFPNSYYRSIKALETGCTHTFDLCRSGRPEKRSAPNFRFEFQVDPHSSETDLAEALAQAFKRAVQRRTLPMFGTIGLGLSGGLDSRAILSAIDSRDRVRAFTLFDEENEEFDTARAIARACGVELISVRRDPEHYGRWAEEGIRISGATGCIRSNHYLGVRRQLQNLGIENLLTGCYCDYVFKGLALNTRESRFARVQELDRFSFEYYLPCYWPHTAERKRVEERLHGSFPYNGDTSEQDWLEIERKRTFPLAYEGDSAMRLIPHRVIPWYLPIADNDLLDVYLRIPSGYKLNSSVFRRMLSLICSPEVIRIPDNNTGARVDAGSFSRACHRYRTALQNRLEQRLRPRLAVRGSWPNWEYYVHNSPVVASTWSRPNATARDLFSGILGEDALARPIQSFRGHSVELFTRIWTLKLWLDQRESAS